MPAPMQDPYRFWFAADPFAPYFLQHAADGVRRVPSRPWWTAKTGDTFWREALVHTDFLSVRSSSGGWLVRDVLGAEVARIGPVEASENIVQAQRAGLPGHVGVLTIVDDRFPRQKPTIPFGVWKHSMCLWSPVGAWAPKGYRVVAEADLSAVRSVETPAETSKTRDEPAAAPLLSQLGREGHAQLAAFFAGREVPSAVGSGFGSEGLPIVRDEAAPPLLAGDQDVVEGAASLDDVVLS